MKQQSSVSVTLINLFGVLAGSENEFVEWWEKSSALLTQEPGFIDATLHRSIQPDTNYQFINVAHWESTEALDLARAKHAEVLRSFSKAKGRPGVYEVVSHYA